MVLKYENLRIAQVEHRFQVKEMNLAIILVLKYINLVENPIFVQAFREISQVTFMLNESSNVCIN